MEQVSNLFRLRGRLNRQKLWIVYLGYALYCIGVLAFFEVAISDLPTRGLFFLIAWLPAAAAFVSTTIRRLHDRGRSAWWLAIFFGLPIIILLAGFTLALGRDSGMIAAGSFNVAVMVLVTAANIPLFWGVVEIGFLRGTLGDNRFGPDPAG